jgi:lysophospholipase L1-like esterase
MAVVSDGAVEVSERTSASSDDVNTQAPDWVAPMRQVHAHFTGKPGTFAQFGDSITESRAFWSSLKWKRDKASDALRADFEQVQRYMLDDCWDRKGPEYGNQGGQTIRWAAEHLDNWLRQWNPEVAVLMFGTNDLTQVDVPEYERMLEDVVKRCLDNGTIVILSTIPPRHAMEDKAALFAAAARRVAQKFQIPLTDYHSEIIQRRPHDWDGALDQFQAYRDYDVPTLIARDGVHPSHPLQYQGDYSEAALNSNGFSLRNYLVVRKYAEVIRNVCRSK